MEISPSEKAIAKHLEIVFSVRPRVFIHREAESDPFYIGIAQVQDYPDTGMVTMSTIGTSNHPLFQEDGSEYSPTRVEFIGSCAKRQENDLGEALFRAAVFVGKVKGFACPGIFLNNLLGEFRSSTPVPHGFLTTPFPYKGLGKPNDFGGRIVSWLQIVPVSASEITYAQEHSTGALETLFEKNDIEWENLDRMPVI